MERVDILSVEIDPLSKEEVLAKCAQFLCSVGCHVVVTPNPEMVVRVIRDGGEVRYNHGQSFWDLLQAADLSVADGVGLLLADKLLGTTYNHQHIPEVYHGADLMLDLCSLAEEESYRVALVGGAEGVASSAATELRRRFPGLVVDGIGGIYSAEPSDDLSLCTALEQGRYDLVFVGFGMEKQESWMIRNKGKVDSVRLMMGVGGAFDFLAQSSSVDAGFEIAKTRRSPRWIQVIWMEWLWRLLRSPWRFRRIWNATAVFLWWVLKYRLFVRPLYRPNVLACVYRDSSAGDREVLVCKRKDSINHWQLVQGGIEDDSPQQAVLRELQEELGVRNSSLFADIKLLPEQHRYKWPFIARYRWYKGRWIGQEQQLFLVRYTGSDEDIELDGELVMDDQFDAVKWVPVEYFLQSLHPIRRSAARLFLPYLQH